MVSVEESEIFGDLLNRLESINNYTENEEQKRKIAVIIAKFDELIV